MGKVRANHVRKIPVGGKSPSETLSPENQTRTLELLFSDTVLFRGQREGLHDVYRASQSWFTFVAAQLPLVWQRQQRGVALPAGYEVWRQDNLRGCMEYPWFHEDQRQ